MKRIFALLAVISVFLGAMAQRPLVTLSHNGELSFFSNLSAFQEALDSAVNGDIIYLSEGKFTASSGSIKIDKLVSIVGCGYKSHILADINVVVKADTPTDHTWFNGVRLQDLNFNNNNGSQLNIYATIKKTWIRNLSYGACAGVTNFYDRCLIERADFAGAQDRDTYIQNSKIKTLLTSSANGFIQVINSNLKSVYYCPKIVISSIIEGDGTMNFASNVKCSIYNSWLPKNLIPSTNVATYDCYFDVPEGDVGLLDDDLEATVNLQEKGYLGEDGTVVGVYGGEFPYSVYPSVPTVDSANSSVEYDADNNKLNVKITVSPN